MYLTITPYIGNTDIHDEAIMASFDFLDENLAEQIQEFHDDVRLDVYEKPGDQPMTAAEFADAIITALDDMSDDEETLDWVVLKPHDDSYDGYELTLSIN